MTSVLRLLPLGVVCMLCSCSKDEPPSHPKAVRVELRRLESSAVPSPSQVLPYEEALVFHSYQVLKVLHGELPDTQIQLGHWAVVDGEAQPISNEPDQVVRADILSIKRVPGADDLYQSNDLTDFDSPQFIELPPASQPVASGFRNHYGGSISKQMTLYWELRNQLELVAIGNSRTGVGVLTQHFFPTVNGVTPIALNLSPPGSNLELQTLLIKDYIEPLPRLRWLVWGICPRYFNHHRRENDRLELFTESHGRQYDLDHWDELWPVRIQNELIHVADLADLKLSHVDSWGATPREDGFSPDLTGDGRAKFLNFFDIVRFSWDQDQWDSLEERVAALHQRDIKVLLFTPPTHPLAMEGRASDPDGSGREHEADVVNKLRALADRLDNVWFEDVHQAGHHGLENEDFSDAGHLDQSGAEKLTARLTKIVHRIDTTSFQSQVLKETK